MCPRTARRPAIDRQTDRRLSNGRAAAELYYIAGTQRAHTHARMHVTADIGYYMCTHTYTHTHTYTTFARRALLDLFPA